MKWSMMLVLCCLARPVTVHAQAQEIKQLLLDVEKLAQFKQILSDMKDGYDILVKGYSTIRDLSEGNFNLHQAFLDGLLDVSPTVQQYKRIADIIALQIRVVNNGKAAIKKFGMGDLWNDQERSYMVGVYQRVISESVSNLSDLADVITAGKMRMSDSERLTAIDQIYDREQQEVDFVHAFTTENNLLLLQRIKALQDVKVLDNLYQK